MAINYAKIEKYLSDYQEMDSQESLMKDLKFLIANCHVLLGDFMKAKCLYEKTFAAMLKPPFSWRVTGEIYSLVDICVLSGNAKRYMDLARELETYRRDSPHSKTDSFSYAALYAFAMKELLLSTGVEIDEYIQKLFKKPKIKEGYTMGLTLQAIQEGDQSKFEDGLRQFLKVHEGIAKHGGLRESAEGLLCMSGMSMAYLAIIRGMKVELENDYLSIGYLHFILAASKK